MPLTVIINKADGCSVPMKGVESVVVMVNNRVKHPKPFLAVDGMARVYFPPTCHERPDFFEMLDAQEKALYEAMEGVAKTLSEEVA